MFTDASKVGIGAVLKQKQSDGEPHPIGYFSRKLLPYQKNYSVSELECLAIVEAVNYWHHYLLGRKFSIYTDHQALKYLHQMKNLNSRLAKWALSLDMYQCQIFYKESKDNVEADCLSRNPIEIHDNQKYIKTINLFWKADFSKSINLISKDEIIKHQKEILQKIKKKKTLQLDLEKIRCNARASVLSAATRKHNNLYAGQHQPTGFFFPFPLSCASSPFFLRLPVLLCFLSVTLLLR